MSVRKRTSSFRICVGMARFFFIKSKTEVLIQPKLIIIILHRSIYTTYERDIETMGITSNRFTVPSEVFDDKNEDNTCYCRFYDKDPNLCFSAGILDMRPCQFG
jgi:hypothetical protein